MGISLDLLHTYHKSSGGGGDARGMDRANAMEVEVKREKDSGVEDGSNVQDNRNANTRLCFIITCKFADEVCFHSIVCTGSHPHIPALYQYRTVSIRLSVNPSLFSESFVV